MSLEKIYNYISNHISNYISIYIYDYNYKCPDFIVSENNTIFNNSSYCYNEFVFKILQTVIIINLFYICLYITINKGINVYYNNTLNKNKLEYYKKYTKYNKYKKYDVIDTSDINLEQFFINYTEIINIQQFLQEKTDDETNLDKIIKFYKESNHYLKKANDIINDKYRNIFLDKDKLTEYYKDTLQNDCYKVFNNNIYTSCSDKISVNLHKLYEIEQFILDESVFDITNKKKYYPLKKDDLCYLTNLPKLNVIIWLIKIGVYDYLELIN
jgi:hypothetical protein